MPFMLSVRLLFLTSSMLKYSAKETDEEQNILQNILEVLGFKPPLSIQVHRLYTHAFVTEQLRC